MNPNVLAAAVVISAIVLLANIGQYITSAVSFNNNNAFFISTAP